jgi:hypothetical protein
LWRIIGKTSTRKKLERQMSKLELIPKPKSDVQFNGDRLQLDWIVPYSSKVGKEFVERYDKIKKLHDDLMEEIHWNRFIYNLNFRFQPVIGNTYYLYKNKEGNYFISLISPKEWRMEFVGEFIFEHNGKWVKKS